MNINQRLAVIKEKLEQLKLKDNHFEIFGAGTHRYQFNPVLTELEISQFEKQHNLQLPEDYRLFIKNIANGGIGPYYGLIPLEEAILVSDNADDFTISSHDIENYLTRSEIAINKGEEDLIEKISIPDPLTGLLCLADYGCGCYLGLVISGEQAGTMWFVETDFKTITPKFTKSGKQQAFLDWYEQWLDNELQLDAHTNESYWNAHSKSITLNGHQLDKLPPEINQCIDLRTLNLENNRLEYFPAEILKLNELRTLDLSMNPMTKLSPDIGKLTKLKRLFLNYSELKSLPLTLAKTQLKELTLIYSNQLKKLPTVINRLANLEILNLSYSYKLADISDMQPLPKLTSFRISNCREIKSLPNSISECNNLEELFIGETTIQRLPDNFYQLKYLKKLDVNIDDLDLEEAFEIIRFLPNLNYLVITNQLAYPGNSHFLTNIKHLVIKQNYTLWRQGKQQFPVAAQITLFPNLEILEFDGSNGQATELPDDIGNMQSLTELYLPRISYFPESMKNMKNLKLIRGLKSRLTESSIKQLKNWLPDCKINIW